MFEVVLFLIASVVVAAAVVSVLKVLLDSQDYVSYSKNENKEACSMDDYAYFDNRYAK